MKKTKRQVKTNLILSGLLILALALFAACSSSSDENGNEVQQNDEMEEMENENMDHEDMENMEDMDHEDGEHEDHDRVPNEGATIRILSPDDGATFAEGEDVLVEVEVTGFALGEDGDHWHVYVDGTSWGMVVGGRTEEALRGLEPGERLIETFLATGSHEELEDGDSITITIE